MDIDTATSNEAISYSITCFEILGSQNRIS